MIKCASQLEIRHHLRWFSIHVEWYDWLQPSDAQSARDLLVFLYQAKPMEGTDARDHIYAFLGHSLMRLKDGSPLVVPNYDKNVKDLYLEIAKQFISKGDTRIMASVEHDENSFSKGSTWAPRWDVDLVISDFGVLPETWYRFSGDMGEKLDPKIRVCGEHIRVSGVLFDIVRKSFRFPTFFSTHDVDPTTPKRQESLEKSDNMENTLILNCALADMKNGFSKYAGKGQDLTDA